MLPDRVLSEYTAQIFSCEVVSSSDIRKNEALLLIHNGSCFETLNLLHVSICKMSYMK